MTPNKSQQKLAWKPLSVEQENAIDVLLTGKTDRETAEAVGVSRWTVQQWRTQHPLFRATLEQKRAEVWRGAQEKLRSLLRRAVENLGAAVEAGDLKASVELLKAVGMYGNGTMNTIGEQDPLKVIEAQAAAQVKAEGISEDPTKDMLIAMTQNPAYCRRLDEVKSALTAKYYDQP
jgi:hypothetical protein